MSSRLRVGIIPTLFLYSLLNERSFTVLTDELLGELRRCTDECREIRRKRNYDKLTESKPYDRIVSIGLQNKREVIQFLLMELNADRDHWFYALIKISGDNPMTTVSAHKGVIALSQDWLSWGREQGYDI